MQGFKFPKNDDKYQWTEHVKGKMFYYGISASLIKRIVRFPKRREEGVAPRTIAVMAPTSSGKQEVWVMFQDVASKRQETRNKGKTEEKNALSLGRLSLVSPRRRIISAWRYPGVSPVNKPIPIPDEILQELGDLIK